MMTNPTGRITQGQFSFLPDLTDAEIAAVAQHLDVTVAQLRVIRLRAQPLSVK